jgi:hypothetical protein
MKHKIKQKIKRIWNRSARRWQTGVLLGGVGLGYLLLLWATGFRAIAWLLGGGVAIAMLVAWFRQFWHVPSDQSPATSATDME